VSKLENKIKISSTYRFQICIFRAGVGKHLSTSRLNKQRRRLNQNKIKRPIQGHAPSLKTSHRVSNRA